MSIPHSIFDVAVIGGGPAGMMAAGRAAQGGAKTVLIEKNARLGEKLLITGGGRCNITNAQPDVRRLVEKYGERGKPLFSVFSRFSSDDTFHFFESRGLPLKVEAEQRAFPTSEKAVDVQRVLIDDMRTHNVTVLTNSPVLGFNARDERITSVRTRQSTVEAKAFVLATGGKSHPETGSTGEGFAWLADLGIEIIEPDPALVPVAVHEPWVQELMGLSLQRAKISIVLDGKKIASRIGKLLFTHFGVSGPGVLNLSRTIGEALKKGKVMLCIDLFPGIDAGELDTTMVEIFDRHKNKRLKNAIGELFAPRLAAAVFRQAGVDGDTALYRLPREDRLKIGAALKAFTLTPKQLLSADEAVVTSGGAALTEIDFATMRCKKFKNLFLAGDVLDFDRPSGGYSLQICWATGWIAGESAAAHSSS